MSLHNKKFEILYFYIKKFKIIHFFFKIYFKNIKMNEQNKSKENIKNNNEIEDNSNNMNSSIENKNLINSRLEESNNSQNQNMNIDEIQDLLEKTEQENTKDKIDNFYLNNTISKFRIKERNLFSDSNLENIQKEIQDMTKKILNEKVKLRICTERYEQKYKTYCEYQGKVRDLTKEEKEKEILERIKKKKQLKISQPLKRKQLKDKIQQEEETKLKKEYNKNKIALGDIENDINKLLLVNNDLKNEITELRKQKSNAILKKENIIKKNKQKEKELEELKENNKIAKSQIKNLELKQSINRGIQQQKDFEKTRDELEIEYYKLMQESIKKEREKKKEHANNKQMFILSNDSTNALFKGVKDKEIEKQLKLISSEEISDRTPIIEELIKKWIYTNKCEKHMIEKYLNNSIKIKEIFEKIMCYNEVKNYDDLILIFQKNEEQMNNVDMNIIRLENEIGNLEKQNIELDDKIKYYQNKKKTDIKVKNDFMNNKNEKIDKLTKDISNLENEIKKKREFFTKIQPLTDEYLSKLNQTYLSDFIPNKIPVDKNLPYTESTVNKFISNIQDYYKLIQNFEDGINDINRDNYENDIDKLRNEMKNKLENFDKGKIINKTIFTTMKNEQKSGLNFDEIIKRNSEMIIGLLNPSINTSMKKKNFGQMYTLNKSSSMKNLKKKTTLNKRIYHGFPQNKSAEEV